MIAVQEPSSANSTLDSSLFANNNYQQASKLSLKETQSSGHKRGPKTQRVTRPLIIVLSF
jgi:hypothetical protein